MTSLTPDKQLEILERGTGEILPGGALLERLQLCAREHRPLRVKQGFDPTAPDIHLGHTVGLRKLRQFQELGHQVVLIVGDYTGMVGDPSGRSKTRPQLTEAEVESNARTYLEQFYRVLDGAPAAPRLPVEVHRNGEWFAPMPFMEVLRLAGQYTVSQLLERDDFSKRFEASQPIGVHELMYPLMQGYDSVAIRADLELGATEQKFNLLVGRELQRAAGQLQQVVMTLPVLPGLDGVQRMSKSLGNYIGVTDAPDAMFGKVMSLPDWIMPKYWTLVADTSEHERRQLEDELGMSQGTLDSPMLEDESFLALSPKVNPMLVKKRLAGRIVTMYHGADLAARARDDFETQFSRREVPEHLDEFHRAAVVAAQGHAERAGVIEMLVGSGIATSKGAARRLVQQGAVSLDGERVSDPDGAIDLGTDHVLRAGRRMLRYRPTAG